MFKTHSFNLQDLKKDNAQIVYEIYLQKMKNQEREEQIQEQQRPKSKKFWQFWK